MTQGEKLIHGRRDRKWLMSKEADGTNQKVTHGDRKWLIKPEVIKEIEPEVIKKDGTKQENGTKLKVWRHPMTHNLWLINSAHAKPSQSVSHVTHGDSWSNEEESLPVRKNQTGSHQNETGSNRLNNIFNKSVSLSDDNPPIKSVSHYDVIIDPSMTSSLFRCPRNP